MKKNNFKNGTMTETDLRKSLFNFSIYPRDSKITTRRGIVNFDNVEQNRYPLELFLH